MQCVLCRERKTKERYAEGQRGTAGGYMRMSGAPLGSRVGHRLQYLYLRSQNDSAFANSPSMFHVQFDARFILSQGYILNFRPHHLLWLIWNYSIPWNADTTVH